jgi:rhamnosyltransferase
LVQWMLVVTDWAAPTLARGAGVDDVCAVVVTYHPDDDVLENLAAVRPQVQGLIVVDNGSPRRAVDKLRAVQSSLGFSMIENQENLGIAAALNQGVRWALEGGYKWVSLFDQDSKVTAGYMNAMLNASTSFENEAGAAILVPQYIDSRRGHILPPSYMYDGNLALAMTSGSFIHESVFKEHGCFAEELFIGGVDYEYSLRLRARGKVLKECRDAVLLHAPSAPQPFRVCGSTLFYTSNYGPLRRYYADRNRVWLLRKYGTRFPGVIYGMYLAWLKDFVKLLLGENDKARKMSQMAQGVVDGLRTRMGRKQSF